MRTSTVRLRPIRRARAETFAVKLSHGRSPRRRKAEICAYPHSSRTERKRTPAHHEGSTQPKLAARGLPPAEPGMDPATRKTPAPPPSAAGREYRTAVVT